MILAAGDPSSIYDLITKGGIPALLFVILYGGYKGWWVFKWQYDDLVRRFEILMTEKNEWKDLALYSTDLAKSLNEIRRNSSA